MASVETDLLGDTDLNEVEIDKPLPRTLKFANIFYASTFIIIAIISFIFYNTESPSYAKMMRTNYTDSEGISTQLATRTAASLALWFGIHSAATVANKNYSESFQFKFHTKWLPLHTVGLIVLIIGFSFADDAVFDAYLQGAIYVSCIYVVFQIYFLIKFFQSLSKMFDTAERKRYLKTITAVLEGISVVIYIMCYVFFAKSNCGLNIGVITSSFVVTIGLFAISIFRKGTSVFTTALVNCYIAYLTAASIMCFPGDNCSRVGAATSNIIFTVEVSVFSLIWMTCSCFSSSYQFNECNCNCMKEKPKFSLAFFHGLYALAAFYLIMVITHWGTTSKHVAWSVDRSIISRVVNSSAVVLSILLYLWMIFAPCSSQEREEI